MARYGITRVQLGTERGGRFYPKKNQKMPKLGSGKRFERCVEEVTARGGAYDPKAVCAARGIAKYGKKRMLKLARAGKKRHHKNPSAQVKKVGGQWYMVYRSRGGSGSAKASSKREAQRWAREYRKSHRSARARNRVKHPRTPRKAPTSKHIRKSVRRRN